MLPGVLRTRYLHNKSGAYSNQTPTSNMCCLRHATYSSILQELKSGVHSQFCVRVCWSKLVLLCRDGAQNDLAPGRRWPGVAYRYLAQRQPRPLSSTSPYRQQYSNQPLPLDVLDRKVQQYNSLPIRHYDTCENRERCRPHVRSKGGMKTRV